MADSNPNTNNNNNNDHDDHDDHDHDVVNDDTHDNNARDRHEIPTPKRAGLRMLWAFVSQYKEELKDVRIDKKPISQQFILDWARINRRTGQKILHGRLLDENNPPNINPNDPDSRRSVHDTRPAYVNNRGKKRKLDTDTVNK